MTDIADRLDEAYRDTGLKFVADAAAEIRRLRADNEAKTLIIKALEHPERAKELIADNCALLAENKRLRAEGTD